MVGAGELVLQGEAEGPVLVQLRGETAPGGTEAHRYIRGGCHKKGARFCAEVHNGRRMRGDGSRLKQERFRLDV